MELDKNYLFMTMTFYWTGRIVSLTPGEIVIDHAAQVFDTGELENAIKTGEVRLCQALPDTTRVTLPRQGTTAVTWTEPLIRTSIRG